MAVICLLVCVVIFVIDTIRNKEIRKLIERMISFEEIKKTTPDTADNGTNDNRVKPDGAC